MATKGRRNTVISNDDEPTKLPRVRPGHRPSDARRESIRKPVPREYGFEGGSLASSVQPRERTRQRLQAQFSQNKRPKRIGNIPPLHYASERGDAERVRRLLSRGQEGVVVNVWAQDPEDDGNTPLHCASRSGQLETASVLMEYGAKIETRNKNNDTSFHVASACGQIRLLRYYMERDIKIEMRGNNQFTPLHAAAENGQPATCKFLIQEAGANVEAQSNRGDSPLHVAAFMGETGAIKMLYRMGADLESRNRMFETPLHRACAAGQVEAVRLLAQRKADLEVRQKYGWTLLHTAASNGHCKVIELLLNYRADVDAQDYNGDTPLHIASFFGKSDVVQLLINQHADVSVLDSQNRTALHHAAWCGQRNQRSTSQPIDNSTTPVWYGFSRTGDAICSVWQKKTLGSGYGREPAPSNLAIIRHLVKANKACVLTKDAQKHSPLHLAACTGQCESCKFLMRSGARVDDRGEGGRTVLHVVACGCGDPDVADLFLDRNVPIDARDKNGDTPLSFACRSGKMDFAKFLIQQGADVNMANRAGGDTPLHRAAENGHIDIAKMLLSLSVNRNKLVDVNSTNTAGDTALIKAAAAGHTGVVWLLLSSGASLEQTRGLLNKKRTALHTAAENGHEDTVKLLIDQGADISIADTDGATALHLAAAGGRAAVCRTLITDYSANTEAIDNTGRTPLLCAVQSSHLDVVQMFLAETDANLEARDASGNTCLHYACDRETLAERDIKLIKSFNRSDLLDKLLRVRNNNGQLPILRLRHHKSQQAADLIRFLSNHMTGLVSASRLTNIAPSRMTNATPLQQP